MSKTLPSLQRNPIAPSVYNGKILLIIQIILILDRRQSVEYSARYFVFVSSNLFIYLFYGCANLSEKYK